MLTENLESYEEKPSQKIPPSSSANSSQVLDPSAMLIDVSRAASESYLQKVNSRGRHSGIASLSVLRLWHQDPMWALAQAPAAPFPVQPPALACGSRRWSKALQPPGRHGDAPGTWVWTGTTLAIATVWGMISNGKSCSLSPL